MSMLNNKVVVITGGAGLLGKAFCSACAAEGAVVMIADANEELAVGAVETLRVRHAGRTIDHWVTDITSLASIRTLIDVTRERHGKIDAVVNNAYPRNPNYGRKFEEVTYEDFTGNVSMHLGGYFLVAQQFAEHFREHGGGSIVNMASVYGVMAPRFEVYEGSPMTMPVEYAAIKAGVLHLTRYMAKYYKGANVRVNAISPGGIFNDQPEAFVDRYNAHGLSKGMLDPLDIAGTLVYLLSDRSRYVNGQNIIVDDGFTL
jgi:NAD(P)-dependent dehydrogenase (short-subunit alcohol dehydrogenase family)